MKQRRIIFLAIDGVLNDNTWDEVKDRAWIQPEFASRLQKILTTTNAQVVLISQRRQPLQAGKINVAGFGLLFRSHGICPNMAGFVPFSVNRCDKTALIKDWLRNNIWSNYVVLDSGDLKINNQIITKDGLTDQNVEDTISILLGDKEIVVNKEETLDTDNMVDIGER